MATEAMTDRLVAKPTKSPKATEPCVHPSKRWRAPFKVHGSSPVRQWFSNSRGDGSVKDGYICDEVFMPLVATLQNAGHTVEPSTHCWVFCFDTFRTFWVSREPMNRKTTGGINSTMAGPHRAMRIHTVGSNTLSMSMTARLWVMN